MDKFLHKLKNKVLEGGSVTFCEAEKLYSIPDARIMQLLSVVSEITKKYRKDTVNLCAITNARSGLCPEDCSFCAQSARHDSGIAVYPLISQEEMFKRAKNAVKDKTNRFCIVTSGRGVKDEEIDTVCLSIEKIKNKFPFLKMDASLGILTKEQVIKLKKSGLDRYNHNLETAESFFEQICSTHTYRDRLQTIRFVKEAGIEICCGGIIGLGESQKQRIEFAFSLKDLGIDSLPLNFLNPVPKTRLEKNAPLPPVVILKTIALFRFVLPEKEIRICGGRQANLRSMQPLIFMAGADAIIIGNYLTTRGTSPQEDIQMIKDLGLRIKDEAEV